MDPMRPLDRFRSACLDWLEAEDPSEVPVPSLEGLTPEEVAQGRRWLEGLRDSREDWRHFPH